MQAENRVGLSETSKFLNEVKGMKVKKKHFCLFDYNTRRNLMELHGSSITGGVGRLD